MKAKQKFLLPFVVSETLALTNMHVKVPEAVKTGDLVTLSCEYDLESAALYTIKWFKNEEEFYRYVPKESPPSQQFNVPHLNVDVSKHPANQNSMMKTYCVLKLVSFIYIRI